MSRRGAIGPSPTAIGVRYGYRRVYVVLDREGWKVRIKMVYNVYRALGLQLRSIEA